jgi:hypothetical protein
MESLVSYYNDVIVPFEFKPGVTPLSDWNVIIVPPVYFSLIWAIKQWIAARGKPFHLNAVCLSFIMLHIIKHR